MADIIYKYSHKKNYSFCEINISCHRSVHCVCVMRCAILKVKYKTAEFNTHTRRIRLRRFLTQFSDSPMLFAEQLRDQEYSALLLIHVKLMYVR
jgi:hypothetical protein